MRAAVYARLSRKKAEYELGVNIEDQKSIGEQLVAKRDWNLIGTFTDDGRGAFQDDAKRPAWVSMLATKPDIIVVRDIERLGRNVHDYSALVKSNARVVEWLDDETAEVLWDAPLQNTDTESFHLRTVGSRAYSQKNSAKIKRKFKVMAAAGEWPPGGTRAFGYHRGCCEDCTPGTVREDEKVVILDLAKRWLDGAMLSHLCRDLAERGITTTANRPWTYGVLRNMLAGPRVAGIRTHNGVETKGQWEPIVDEKLHRDLVTAASESLTKRTNANGTYLLTGLVWCVRCDVRMYGRRRRGGSRPVSLGYACIDGCGGSIAALQTDKWVVDRSANAILAPEWANRDETRRDLANTTGEVRELEARIEELDQAYWQDRSISKDRWLAASTQLTATLEQAQGRFADLKRQLTSRQDAPATAEALFTRWKTADNKERNRLLSLGVAKVLIYPATRHNVWDPTRIETHFHDGRVNRTTAEDIVQEDIEPELVLQ